MASWTQEEADERWFRGIDEPEPQDLYFSEEDANLFADLVDAAVELTYLRKYAPDTAHRRIDSKISALRVRIDRLRR